MGLGREVAKEIIKAASGLRHTVFVREIGRLGRGVVRKGGGGGFYG